MKRKNVICTFLAVFGFLMLLSTKAEASWKQENGKYYYYDSKGVVLKNQKIGDYYVGADGARYINRHKGKDFYGEDGKRIPDFHGGWQTIQGKRYYYTAQGKKVTGWLKYRGKNIIWTRMVWCRQGGSKLTGFIIISQQEENNTGQL